MSKDFTEEEIVAAVHNSRGIVSVIARSLGCDWHTARKYIDLNPEAKLIEVDEREKLCDSAESTVVTLMTQSKDEKVKFNAATYLLDRLAKNRGFTTRQDIGLTVNTPTIIHDDVPRGD